MTDFWIEVLWTFFVTIALVLADWLAGALIVNVRVNAAIQRAIEQAPTDRGKLSEIRKYLEKRRAWETEALAWGADLTALAISLDFAALLLWHSNPVMFPFFSRWNTASVSREIPVWLVLFAVHSVLLLASIFCKHLHGERVEMIVPPQMPRLFRKGWVGQNLWMLTSNVIGFLTLLSSFVVVTNAI